MNRTKNEQGYALILVLLITVVFSIVALSFSGQFFSSMKQSQLVEKKDQSVALAEMGVQYYQGVIQNIYKSNQQTVETQIQQMIDEDKNKSSLHSSSYYAEQAATLMREAIQQNLDNEHSEVTIDRNASFKIVNNDFGITNNQPYKKFSLEIEGIENGKGSTITTEMTIAPNVSGISDTGTGEPPLLSIILSFILPDFNSITRPIVDSLCTTPSSLQVDCSQILINGNKFFNENDNGLSNKTIFTTGALTIDGNVNQLLNMKIHSDGALSIGKNMNKLTSSVLESKDNATFGSQLTLDNSKLYTRGNLNVDGHLNLENNSFMYIGGNEADISKQLNIEAGSKLCVAGDLTIGNQKPIYGVLVVKGKINGDPTNITDEEFHQKCGTSTTTQVPTVEWGEQLENNITYNY